MFRPEDAEICFAPSTSDNLTTYSVADKILRVFDESVEFAGWNGTLSDLFNSSRISTSTEDIFAAEVQD